MKGLSDHDKLIVIQESYIENMRIEGVLICFFDLNIYQFALKGSGEMISIVSISYRLTANERISNGFSKGFPGFKEAFRYANDEIYELLEAGLEIEERNVVIDEIDKEKGSFSFLVQSINQKKYLIATIQPIKL